MTSDNTAATGLTKADLSAILADAFAPWVQDLNLSVDDIGSDGITMRLPADARLSRIGGIVSGQAMTAMADTTMVLALATHFGGFRPVATVDIAMSFMRAIKSSDVLCQARVRRAGRSLAFVHAELRGAEDTQVAAVANGTFAIPDTAARHEIDRQPPSMQTRSGI
ncbi:PaaI family thioesterase [Bradyrhizobium sp. AZCC 2230]|uniref:PaaI family thioesterase n=1 Tax=Bradyrhizobium sp. AZCC 2230 TaxID=3117021 RepID=UPI002FEFB514